MLTHYILNGKEPVDVTKAEWAKWCETADRHVAKTDITSQMFVSTLFTGLQLKGSPPMLFETAVCGQRGVKQMIAAYSTWEEAERGHQQAVHDVRLVQRMS
jgi:hypothetical protein